LVGCPTHDESDKNIAVDKYRSNHKKKTQENNTAMVFEIIRGEDDASC
jgi:hypothetical protein